MLHTFNSVAFVTGIEENEGFKSWLVSLDNEKGLPVTIAEGRETFYLAEGYVDACFNTKGINPSLLSTGEKYQALSKATFDCTLIYKKKGESFVAKVAKGLVNTGTEKKPKWTVPVVGETYTYQETGIMPDWSVKNHISFPEETFDKLIAITKNAETEKLLFEAKMKKIEQMSI